MTLALTLETVETPIGDLHLVADDEGLLRAVDFADCEDRLRRLLNRRLGSTGYVLSAGCIPRAMPAALRAYFCGKLGAIGGIPIDTGGTPFQASVWTALRSVPPGRVVSYSTLAGQLLAKPNSARAVGHANGVNPFCIVVPCHRVVAHDGKLTGYCGGMQRKRWLLDHEARYAGAS